MDSTFLMQEIDFGRKNKIALGQAVDLVGPDPGVHSSPGKAQVRMVALPFSQRAHAVHKIQSGLEIGKLECAGEMVTFHNLPARSLRLQPL
jgi:hypothetical protein